jgi:hypothetical protein
MPLSNATKASVSRTMSAYLKELCAIGCISPISILFEPGACLSLIDDRGSERLLTSSLTSFLLLSGAKPFFPFTFFFAPGAGLQALTSFFFFAFAPFAAALAVRSTFSPFCGQEYHGLGPHLRVATSATPDRYLLRLGQIST